MKEIRWYSRKNWEILEEKIFIKALKSATDTAYKAVSKPKEGTILTVSRAISEFAVKYKKKDFEEFFPEFIQAGQEA